MELRRDFIDGEFFGLSRFRFFPLANSCFLDRYLGDDAKSFLPNVSKREKRRKRENGKGDGGVRGGGAIITTPRGHNFSQKASITVIVPGKFMVVCVLSATTSDDPLDVTHTGWSHHRHITSFAFFPLNFLLPSAASGFVLHVYGNSKISLFSHCLLRQALFSTLLTKMRPTNREFSETRNETFVVGG